MNIMHKDNAIVSMDFVTGVGVLLLTFLFAVHTISGVITPFGGYSKTLYPEADRVSSLLIEDEGYWTDGYEEGTDWNTLWASRPTYVKKIGFLSGRNSNLIDTRKLLFMKEHTIGGRGSWWEYPTDLTDPADLENVSRAIGLERYQFYLQVRPLNESLINIAQADAGARNMVNGNDDVVAVTRLAMMEHTTFGEFNGTILAGPSSSKILITFETSEFDVIHEGIKFTISGWVGNGTIHDLKIGDSVNSNYEIMSSGGHSSGSLDNDGKWYYVWSNGINITNSDEVIVNEASSIEYFIPASTIENFIPQWDASGRNIYVEMALKGDIIVTSEGETLFSATKKTDSYPAKITLWVW